MKLWRQGRRRWLGLLVLPLVLLVAMSAVAFAQVEQVGDNCWKIDNPQDGSYELGDCTVELTFTDTPEGQEFSFSVTGDNCAVTQVTVSGGGNDEVFSYDPPATSGTGLHAPQVSSGRWADVSNITFCFTTEETTTTEAETTTTTAEETTTTTAEDTTTTTAEETTTTEAETTTTTAAETTTTEAETTTTVADTTTTSEMETTTTTVGGITTTTAEETTTTTAEETTTTTAQTTTTEAETTSTTAAGLTTVSQVQTGEGPPPAGPSAGTWALIVFTTALAAGVGWSTIRAFARR